METNTNLNDEFEKELDFLQKNSVLNSEFRKKRLMIWAIRTLIAAILYYIFWEYNWIQKSLFFYIPLNLFSLFSIFGWTSFLNRKVKKTIENIEITEKVSNKIKE